MPGWGEILQEFQASAGQHNGSPDNDGIRRKYVRELAALTGRSTILYASAWLSKPGVGDQSIGLQDMHGLMEACRGLPGPSLDIVVHSAGGTAEAVSSIVSYLRQKYTDIRVIVPLAAMSAATMWALSANRVVMGKHSQLGPIDPQLMIPQAQGGILPVPARTILDQFAQASDEIAKDSARLGAWAPMLPQYGPGLLQMCDSAHKLSLKLVRTWLAQYMFAGEANAEARADAVAAHFGDYSKHNSHSVGIFRDEAQAQGIVIEKLEDNVAFQDAVLSVFHSTMLTFNFSNCIKMIENSLGRGFYVSAQTVTLQGMMPGPQPAP